MHIKTFYICQNAVDIWDEVKIKARHPTEIWNTKTSLSQVSGWVKPFIDKKRCFLVLNHIDNNYTICKRFAQSKLLACDALGFQNGSIPDFFLKMSQQL